MYLYCSNSIFEVVLVCTVIAPYCGGVSRHQQSSAFVRGLVDISVVTRDPTNQSRCFDSKGLWVL